MCKNAVGSDRNHLGEGINTSVQFMIGMVFLVLLAFLGLVAWSFHAERRRAGRGEAFDPPGKLRWSSEDFEKPRR